MTRIAIAALALIATHATATAQSEWHIVTVHQDIDPETTETLKTKETLDARKFDSSADCYAVAEPLSLRLSDAAARADLLVVTFAYCADVLDEG